MSSYEAFDLPRPTLADTQQGAQQPSHQMLPGMFQIQILILIQIQTLDSSLRDARKPPPPNACKCHTMDVKAECGRRNATGKQLLPFAV